MSYIWKFPRQQCSSDPWSQRDPWCHISWLISLFLYILQFLLHPRSGTTEKSAVPSDCIQCCAHIYVEANRHQRCRLSRVWGRCRSSGPAFSADRSGTKTEIPIKIATRWKYNRAKIAIVYYRVDLALRKRTSHLYGKREPLIQHGNEKTSLW